MKNITYYFSSYNQYHATRGNKLTHYIGIPMIVFSTFGLLSRIQFLANFNIALIVWLFSSLFYCRLDWKRGLPFSALTFIFYWASLGISNEIHWILFIVGWIFQGIGHYVYEKKSPAFLTNLSHIFIGPFWIFCRLWPVKVKQ